MAKEDVFKYTSSVDLDVAEMYADERCKHCYGRGYIKSQVGTVRKMSIVQENIMYCKCVRKNAEKYG